MVAAPLAGSIEGPGNHASGAPHKPFPLIADVTAIRHRTPNEKIDFITLEFDLPQSPSGVIRFC
jgi:hypothetical protein